jgi:hypothetical protein
METSSRSSQSAATIPVRKNTVARPLLPMICDCEPGGSELITHRPTGSCNSEGISPQ